MGIICESVEPSNSRQSISFTADQLNPISDTARSYQAIVFNSTGKLINGSAPTIKISDNIYDGSGLTNDGTGSSYRPRGSGKNYLNISVNKYTGRVVITGP